MEFTFRNAVFGVLFAAIPFGLMGLGIWQAGIQHRRISHAMPTTATVTGKRVHVSSDSDGDSYRPVVEYDYAVDGVPYHGSEVFPLRIGAGERWAKGMIAPFDVGGTTTAYYDAAHPDDAFLLKRYSFFPYVFILFPMVFIVLLLGAVIPNPTPDLPSDPAPLPTGDYGWSRPGQGAPTPRLIVCSAAWHGVGLLACGHFFFYASPPYGWFAIIATAIYEGLGAYPLLALYNPWSAGRQFGTTQVGVDCEKLQLGRPVQVRIAQDIRREVELGTLDVKLIYQYSEADKKEFRHTLQEGGLFRPGQRIEATARLVLPDDLPADADTTDSNTGWRLRVITTCADGRSYTAEFPLFVWADSGDGTPDAASL